RYSSDNKSDRSPPTYSIARVRSSTRRTTSGTGPIDSMRRRFGSGAPSSRAKIGIKFTEKYSGASTTNISSSGDWTAASADGIARVSIDDVVSRLHVSIGRMNGERIA